MDLTQQIFPIQQSQANVFKTLNTTLWKTTLMPWSKTFQSYAMCIITFTYLQVITDLVSAASIEP